MAYCESKDEPRVGDLVLGLDPDGGPIKGHVSRVQEGHADVGVTRQGAYDPATHARKKEDVSVDHTSLILLRRAPAKQKPIEVRIA